MIFSSERAKRVICSFIDCVRLGLYEYSYAVLRMEDSEKYGYLTDADKAVFYAELEEEVRDAKNFDRAAAGEA